MLSSKAKRFINIDLLSDICCSKHTSLFLSGASRHSANSPNRQPHHVTSNRCCRKFGDCLNAPLSFLQLKVTRFRPPATTRPRPSRSRRRLASEPATLLPGFASPRSTRRRRCTASVSRPENRSPSSRSFPICCNKSSTRLASMGTPNIKLYSFDGRPID